MPSDSGTAMQAATVARNSVLAKRVLSCSAIGRLLPSEMPKSPWTAPHSQLP